MMKHHYPVKSNLLEIIKTLSVVIPFFLIFISYLYLATYYSFFDLNIFNYLSVNAIILYAIVSIGLVTILAVLGYIMAITYDFLLEVLFKSADWVVSKYSLRNKKFIAIIFGVFLFFLVPVLAWFFPYFIDNTFTNVKFNLLYKIAFTLFLVPLIIISPAKRKLLTPKSFFIGLIIITSILSITKAYIDALYFSKNISYKYVVGSDLKGDYPDKKLKLIGKADDHYFLKHPDKEPVIIKKYEDFKRLHIHTFKDTTGAK